MNENLKYNDKPDSVWHYCLERVSEPLEVLYDGDLINVDDFVHVVYGKVICWNREDLALNDNYILNIIEYARDRLYISPRSPRFTGDGNVLFLVAHESLVWPEARFAATNYDINDLPDVLRHNIKLCCPYYEEHGL